MSVDQDGCGGWAGSPAGDDRARPLLRSALSYERVLSEAERAFALAEQLGSVNAAATELGTTWPSLRKAFTRHGLGMPARNPQAVRQRGGRPATPSLDPAFVALNPGALPARERPAAELYDPRSAADWGSGPQLGLNLQVTAYARRIGSTWDTQRRAPLTQRYWEAMKLPEGLDDRSAVQRANLGPSAPLNEARVSTQDVGPALSWIG
jgi:hypothetical protein